MKSLSVKDNSKVNKDQFNDIPSLTDHIANKTLEQLEKEGIFVFPETVSKSKDLDEEQMIIQEVNDTYVTGNIMGYIGYGDERLAITSRFNEGDDYLFQYLLEKVLDFPNVFDLKTDSINNDRMFSLLIFLFPSYLSAAVRKGLFKQYVTKHYNDDNVRGSIEIDRHIKHNTPFVGNIAYSQREYTQNNYLTHLIRYTIEFIKKKPYGARILRKVKDETRLIVNATPDYDSKSLKKFILQNKKHIVRHAFYHEYRLLQKLCILILCNDKHQVGVGHQKIHGILFDGSWLWEEYINSIIGEYFFHPMNKERKGGQWLFAGNTGRIYPDFIGKNINIVADAKYKPLGNIRGDDYLQLLAYMMRFEVPKAIYFYPETSDSSDISLFLNRGNSYLANVTPRNDLSVIKHGLIIPKDMKDYKDFSIQMKKNESLFVSFILTLKT